MVALFSVSLMMGAALSSCRSRTQALSPSFSSLSPGISAQRFQSFSSSRDLFQLLDQYHAPLMQRNPGLIKLKYDAMKSSAFAFYRATAFVFYHDMASQKALNQTKIKSEAQGQRKMMPDVEILDGTVRWKTIMDPIRAYRIEN